MHPHSLRLSGALLGLACALHTPLSAATPDPDSLAPTSAAAGSKTKPTPKPGQAGFDRWVALTDARELTFQGKEQAAVERLRQAVDTRPGQPVADVQLAELIAQVAALARNENDGPEAAKLAALAIGLAEHRTAGWPIRDRVRAATISGDLAEQFLADQPRALKAYKEVLQLEPANRSANAHVTRLEAEQKRPQQREKERLKLLANAPKPTPAKK
jgi:hypothetical protein